MSFDQFLDALVDIACHYLYPALEGIYSNASGDAIAFGNLLLNDVLPNARNIGWGRQQVEWTSRQDHIENHEVQDVDPAGNSASICSRPRCFLTL